LIREADRQAAILKLIEPVTVSEAVDRNAREMGDVEGVVDATRRLTWSQVKERSDRLAMALLDLGLLRNDVVLVQMANGVDLYTVRVGCEKAGVRQVAVPVTFREAELRAIVETTRPVMAFVAPEYRGFSFANTAASLLQNNAGFKLVVVAGDTSEGGAISLEEFLSEPARDSSAIARTRLGFFDIAEIQTTSGSTGVPKCVDVPIAARTLTGHIHAQRFGVTSSDVIMALTPMVSGTSGALAYFNGARLHSRVVFTSHFDAAEVLEFLRREKVTVAVGVPTMLAQLVRLPEFSRSRLPDLRVIVSHGSLLVEELGREIEARTGARIVQAYGSTDFGGLCASRYEDLPEVRLRTVGSPLEGNELRLVDDEGRDVPRGEVGRILVRGLHAHAGYHRNPQLWADAWATGYFDMQEFGRFDDEGNLSMAGRLKDIIIRGGQNIYPADVENLLAKHPSVAEVAVIGVPDREYGEKVCACVVPQPGQILTFEEMIEFLRLERIASFKLPERLEIVNELPKGAGGMAKVDKAALRAKVAAKLD